MQMKGQEHAQNIQFKQVEAVQKQRQADDTHQMNLRQQLMDHLFQNQKATDEHQLSLQQQKEQGTRS